MTPSRTSPVVCLFILAAMSSNAAAAQQRPYIGPVLQVIQKSAVRRAIERAPRLGPAADKGTLPLGGAVALDRGPAGTVRAGIFVRLHQPISRSLAALRSVGAEIGTVVDDIATARVPLDALDRLSRSGYVQRIEAAPVVEVENDSGIVAIRADDVRVRRGGSWYGSVGQGVIVGIYDTGLDYDHPDFLDANGLTRVRGLWDQTRTGSGPPNSTYDYGTYCGPASLNANTCAQRDINGHGTHIAGTAAGDGSATGSGGIQYRYAGVAPAADLLIVKGGDAFFAFDQMIDGVAWIFDVANSFGRPAVVNISLGTQSGPHDGTTLAEEMLNDLSGPGNVVVVSAGNGGSNGNAAPASGEISPLERRYIHAMAVASISSTDTLSFDVTPYGAVPGACNDAVIMELWYEGTDALNITVVRPDGSKLAVAHADSATSESSQGQVFIFNAVDGPNPENGDNEAFIQISDCGSSGAPAPGEWLVLADATVAASGAPFHLWTTVAALGGGDGTTFGRRGFDNRFVISSPGTAAEVVTVGAFATKLRWQSEVGGIQYSYQEAKGDLAVFSSGGPTRDGRLKPEIVAPGKGIMSALSSNADFPPALTDPDGVHGLLSGTSMAAPHVTGAIALMLQTDPTLTAAEVKANFQLTAADDMFTTRTYAAENTNSSFSAEDWWGYGKLDVYEALDAMGAFTTVTQVVVAPAADTTVVQGTFTLDAAAYNGLGAEVPGSSFTWTSRDPAVATVNAEGTVTAVALGDATIVGESGGVRDSTFVSVYPPATLIVAAEPAEVPDSLRSAEGTRVPLLALDLSSDGYEAIRIESIGLRVSGNDPGPVPIEFVRDVNADGALGPADTAAVAVSETALSLEPGQPVTVSITPASLSVPGQSTISLLATIVLSGRVPNGASFRASFLPELTSGRGVDSGASQEEGPAAAVASAPVPTTVLESSELFALSENPILSGSVIFNFAERPAVAAIYSLDGRRVRDLTTLLSQNGHRIEWDLTNSRGSPVAPGVYLAIFDIGGELINRKLFIVRRGGGSP